MTNQTTDTRALIAELVGAQQNLIRAYVNLMEAGRDRIVFLGGECDTVDKMEASDPALREAKAALTKGRAALDKTQVEDESCSSCKNNKWPFGSCDVCGVQNDDPDSGSNWEHIEHSTDCDICGIDCPLHQASEQAPSTAERVPLTDEQIEALWFPHYSDPLTDYTEFARAIEAAHGITQKGGAK